MLLLLTVAMASIVMRPVISNVTAYVAFIVPVGMAIGEAVGLNPLVTGMATVVVGGQLTFYAAQQNGTMLLMERANLNSMDLLRLALLLGISATLVLFLIGVPYWSLLGESLTQ